MSHEDKQHEGNQRNGWRHSTQGMGWNVGKIFTEERTRALQENQHVMY